MTPVWGHIHLPPLVASARELDMHMPMANTIQHAPLCTMAHLMAPLPATTQHTTIVPKVAPRPPALKNSGVLRLGAKCYTRRAFLHGLMVASGGAGSLTGADIAASAASKRRAPPPAPTEEKKDPNVSGVQAKVLASKRRKEAMKESVAKMREKGKPVGN